MFLFHDRPRCRPAIDALVEEFMNRNVRSSFVALLLLISSGYAAKVGESAPDFQATASNGQVYKLSQYRGQFVVLEWHNNGCPYTRKHYESGNMERQHKSPPPVLGKEAMRELGRRIKDGLNAWDQ